MNALLTATVVSLYFIMLLIVSRLTAKSNDNQTFFTANRSSPWYLVAFGMIGTTISGVTFISIPGEVGVSAFSYFQLVLGYFFGYLVILGVLLPLYYKLNLTSIYTYLEERFGAATYKTGSFFFLLSRSLGAALRLFLAATVFQIFIFSQWGVPFEVTVIISMALILLYSIRGGIQTIVWTDTLQTIFLIASLVLTIVFINNQLDLSLMDSVNLIADSEYSKIFDWDINSRNYFWKQFLAGMFITITMTGLDQDMMQKNLTVRTLRDSQKNMFVFSLILIAVNWLFLSLGALLYIYSNTAGVPIPELTDKLFPFIAFNHFPAIFAFIFLIGLTAATFASTDSALAALTTSFCVDMLGFNKAGKDHSVNTRYKVHIGISAVIVLMVIVFHYLNDQSVISALFKIAGYTYGPLLGFYAFGMSNKRPVYDPVVPYIAFGAPLLTYGIEWFGAIYFPEYKFGFETLIINGLIVYLSLYILSFSALSKSKKNN